MFFSTGELMAQSYKYETGNKQCSSNQGTQSTCLQGVFSESVYGVRTKSSLTQDVNGKMESHPIIKIR